MKIIPLCCALFLAMRAFAADSTVPASTAINSFGLDLLRAAANPKMNALFSPYAVESALALTYAGADGVTRDEMARTLHFETNEPALHGSFGMLQNQLKSLTARSSLAVSSERQHMTRVIHEPIQFTMPDRLIGGGGFGVQISYLNSISNSYQPELVQFDFSRDPYRGRKLLNDWIYGHSSLRFPNLIPEEDLGADPKLVLVSAIFLKTSWAHPFEPASTKPAPFHLATGASVDVPMMWKFETVGFMKYNKFTAIAVPFFTDELQFLVLLPDTANGLGNLESEISQLGACANLPKREILLGLPKFKITPPMLHLNALLRTLGLNTAFDETANFSRLSKDKIFVTGVFHKTFLALDEKGSEAPETYIVSKTDTNIPEMAVTVTVDHPFLFAVQHRPSGACLFLGHVADPR